MDPVTLALTAASIGGAILGGKNNKPKSIDPEWLKKHFGAAAVSEEMVQLFNRVINSPHGQQIMASAAEQGQQFQADTARQLAASGMGPSGGADSGASIFTGAAAGGATNALQRGVRADVMSMTMPIAQRMVEGRMNAAVQGELNRLNVENSQPSMMNMIGQGISRGANAALAAGPGTQQTGQGRTMEVNKGLPVGALNEALNTPLEVGLRGQSAGMTSSIPQNTAGASFKRAGFLSGLGNRLRGGIRKLATPLR